MQMDFGEEGEDKSFVVIDAEPRRPAQVQRVRYKGAKPLCTVRATLQELENRAAELREAGWLRVKIPIDTRDPELNTQVRRLLPNTVKVDFDLPEVPLAETSRPPAGSPPRDLFRAYFRSRHGRDPDDVLVAAFDDLLGQAREG
jgi:hypothetical protein